MQSDEILHKDRGQEDKTMSLEVFQKFEGGRGKWRRDWGEFAPKLEIRADVHYTATVFIAER